MILQHGGFVLRYQKWWHRFWARHMRYTEGLCPRCCSDMPAIDSCGVCDGGKLAGWQDKNILWARWAEEKEVA